MGSALQSTEHFDPTLVGRAHRAVEPLHSQIYFSAEQDQLLTGLGLKRGRQVYFASRAAAMGAVGAGTLTATFYNFSPSLVARHIPLAWTIATPEQVLAARFEAARGSLTRLLGADVAGGPEVAELAGLLREACEVLTPEGRPLYAGHADLEWPSEPVLQMWHAATLLREHRGDGHIAVLLHSGLSGLEALITHTATGRGFTEPAAKASRGWTEEEWGAACAALADRGLLDDAGLTEEGQQLRTHIEVQTDALAADPWLSLGAERTARVVELAKGLARLVVANGAFANSGLAGR